MFTKLYLETTNPNLGFSQMFGPKILGPMIFSILVHTIVYTLFCNMISWIFFDSILSKVVNKRLLVSLLAIMTFGFFGRFFHVKEIYNAYGRDMKKTRKYIDKHYVSWVFLSQKKFLNCSFIYRIVKVYSIDQIKGLYLYYPKSSQIL